MCDVSHLSVDFLTRKPDGLLLYNGPIVPPEPEEIITSDFISLELVQSQPRLLIDFGSGTLELRITTKNGLDDGDWHRIDIFWDPETVRMVVDYCKSADIGESEDGTPPMFDDSTCQAQDTIPPFNEYLNVNAPLQIGGMHAEQFDPIKYKWQYMPVAKGFDGCIRNIVHNSKIYDLSEPGLSRGSYLGCPQVEQVCNGNNLNPRCGDHGICVGSLTEPHCECKPGWTGQNCNIETVPSTFDPQSYVKYALSFEPDKFLTQIQLKFRTREEHGELFRVSDQHNREYGILEVKDSKLHFRYNLNNLRTEEKELWLNSILVDDGQWHTAKVSRYGSAAILELDGGEGRRYNETFTFEGHQWMIVDKQEGVYAGGKAEYTGVRTFEVYADYQKGCLDDIRLEGKHLPLPPALNGTQWGQATMAKNVKRNCPSNKPCDNVICPPPFECIDLWMDYECTCPKGRIRFGPDKCKDENECERRPCENGGACQNYEDHRRYKCICPPGYSGLHCELETLEAATLTTSTEFIVAFTVCLLILLILVLVFVVYNRRREGQIKYPGPDDDVRENIINYDDEGGGEDDMTAFDITPLQIPIGGPGPEAPIKMPYPPLGQEPNVGIFIDDHKKRADCDPSAPPFDDLRNYAYEGGGSTAGSLSSLQSGTDDNEQDFDYLNGWGPRFQKLADMYGHGESEEEEQ